jgi:amino acid transporter
MATERKPYFLRAATGLVREAGALDILSMAVLNCSIGMGVFWLILWGPYLFPGGDLALATLITFAFAVFGSLTWALLASVFPRSGGDYIFNSRILHPVIGFLTSTGWVVANFIWCAILAAYVADPGLSTMFALLGNSEAAAFMASPSGLILVGTIIIFSECALLIRSFKAYLWFQLATFIVAMASLIVAIALVVPISRADFISAFNAYSAQYGSPDYNSIINLAKAEGIVNPGFSWAATLGLLPVAYWSVGYQYFAAYIAGETKKVSRNMLIGIVGATILCAFIMAYAGWLFVEKMGYDFLLSIVVVWDYGLGYKLPVGPYFNLFSGMLTPNVAILGLVGLNLALWNLVYPALSLIGQSRITLAWSFDRLVPSWLGDVSDRFHTPVKNLIFFAVCGEIILILFATYLGLLGSYSPIIIQSLTTFMLTAIAAIVLPFRKKVKDIYDASPVSKYKIGPVPFISICGVIYLIFEILVVYYFVTCPGLGAWHVPSLTITAIILAASVVYFYAIRFYRKKQGIDIDLAFKELPPE